ncbi:hypothetical protein D3C76_603340 [compost metagenome]
MFFNFQNEITDRFIAFRIASKCKSIYEHTDQVFQLRMRSAGYWRSNDDILLPGILMKQCSVHR